MAVLLAISSVSTLIRTYLGCKMARQETQRNQNTLLPIIFGSQSVAKQAQFNSNNERLQSTYHRFIDA